MVIHTHQTVLRTKRERWLSWPWKPWVKFKQIPLEEPSYDFVVLDDKIIGHPTAVAALREMQL